MPCRNNRNSGFVAYSSYDTRFENCTFRNNYNTLYYNETQSLLTGDYQFAGGLTLLWRNQTEQSNTVFLKNCTFVNNTASVSSSNNDSTRPNLYVPRGHGGAIVASFNVTNNHTLMIEDCTIVGNSARFNGGGLYLNFYNISNSNVVVINRTLFERNTCNNTGGAISMNTFEVANFNKLIVWHSAFSGNRAWVGGGACSINLQVGQVAMCIDYKL